jgi:Flp pilus assembly protein TadD
MNHHRSWGIGAIALCSVAALSGCQSKMESAWSLIKEQQAQQALMQQAEDDATSAQSAEPQLALSLIRETQRQGKDFASLAYIDAYEQRFGSTDEVAILRADALRRVGRGNESKAIYQRLTPGSQAARAWHGLGLLAGERGDYAAAIDSLARATQLAPTSSQMLGDLGFAYLLAGDTAEARLPLGKAAELDPTNSKVLANMALLLLIEGQVTAAQQLMDQAALSDAARNEVTRLSMQMRALVPVSGRHAPQPVAAAIAMSPGATLAAVPVSTEALLMQPVMERMSPAALLRSPAP